MQKMHQLKAIMRSDYFILFLMASVYVAVISFLAISRHNSFGTNTWDLGIYSQSLYSTINHGKLLYYTAELSGNPSSSLFGIHFTPFLLLLAPIYTIFQNPITLLVLRPIAITLGLIPLYWIIREKQLNSRLVTFFLAAIYLVFPPITTPLSNFDITVFLPVLFLFAIHYLQKGKLVHSFVFVVLALMVNEFVPLIVMAMALYVFVLNRKEIVNALHQKTLTKHATFGTVLFLTAIVWFSVASAVITSFNPTALTTKWEWGELGNSPIEIVGTVVTDPLKAITVLLNDGQSKFLYIASLFGPLAFLSFLDPLTLIMTLPWLAASLLSVNPLYYAVGTHYPAFISPFLFVAAINGIKKLVNTNSRDVLNKIVFLMFVSLICSTFLLPTDDYFVDTQSDESTRIALTYVPQNASAAVMPEIFPHLCNSIDVYPYFKDNVEYVLIDVYSWWYTVTLPRPAHLAPRWCDAQISENYGLIVNANGVLLYKNGYTGPVKHFEPVNFTYSSHDVQIATGKIVKDAITIGESETQTDVLVHSISDPSPLFFEVPENVLPPGDYNANITLKTSSLVFYGKTVTLDIFNEPEHTNVITKDFNGEDFSKANAWQTLSFNFTVGDPSTIAITAYVTDSVDVYFHSLTILQVSGGNV